MRTSSIAAVGSASVDRRLNEALSVTRPIWLFALSLLLGLPVSWQALPPFTVPPADVKLLSPRGFSVSIPGSTHHGIFST